MSDKINDIVALCKSVFEIKDPNIKANFQTALIKSIQGLSAEEFWNIYSLLDNNVDLTAYISFLRTVPLKTGTGFYIG